MVFAQQREVQESNPLPTHLSPGVSCLDPIQSIFRYPYLIGQFDKAVILRLVGGREEVSDGEKEKEELDRGPNGIVLIARLHVAQEDSGPW